MERFDTPDPSDQELEGRLRAERPRPSTEFVDRVAGAHRPRRVRGTLTVRLAVAAALTALLATAAVTAGGSSPLRAFDQAKDAVQGTASAPPSGASGGGSSANSSQPAFSTKASPGADQYQERITICHRGNSPNNKGETLTLPRQAAEAHLRQHRYDTRGPCPAPPPPNVTICHRVSKNDKGQTLTLPQPAAEQHLRDHKYDKRGACPK